MLSEWNGIGMESLNTLIFFLIFKPKFQMLYLVTVSFPLIFMFDRKSLVWDLSWSGGLSWDHTSVVTALSETWVKFYSVLSWCQPPKAQNIFTTPPETIASFPWTSTCSHWKVTVQNVHLCIWNYSVHIHFKWLYFKILHLLVFNII